MSKVFGVPGMKPEKVQKRSDVKFSAGNPPSSGKGTFGVDSCIPEKETGKRHTKMGGGGTLQNSKVRPKF